MALIEREYTDLLKENMLSYYDEILNHRAIPETRDGLMEVQRRILWSCYKNKWMSNRQFVKCAKINGMVLTYHPHGDSAVYDALVNLSQDWKNHIPMIETFGSNGSIYGDDAAAPRYLEARMSKEAELIYIDELGPDCVDFVDNYDLTEKEPMIMPGRIPMYLINGAFGISGGYAISVPTHNPVEVIDETINLIKNPNHKVSLKPDFPNGGVISNTKDLEDAYRTGRGKVQIRGKFERDEKKHQLILTEIPYMKSLDKIKEEIKNLASEKKESKGKKSAKVIPAKIPGIKNIKDGSSDNKIRLVIEVKKDYPLDLIENQLYQFSSVQSTMPFILLGTTDRKFNIHANVNSVLEEWIDFRRVCIKRIKLGLIKKYKYRVHIIDGLLKILDPKVVEKVLAMIRACKDRKEVISKLMSNYDLTVVQAENIADMKLYRLSAMSLQELVDERTELLSKIDVEIDFFKHIDKINALIIEDLEFFRNRYKKMERKTVVVDKFEDTKDALVPDTEHTLIVTKEGYVKKLPPITSQRRNGKGVNVGKMKEGDYPVFVEQLSNKDSLFIFTEVGKAYKYLVSDLNESTTNTLGNFISSSINGEKITSCIKIPHDLNTDDYGILLSTRLNKIKITEFKEFNNINKSGIIASKLADNDIILSATLIKIKGERFPKDIIITHTGGNSSLIDSEEVPLIGRTTFGSMAMHNDVIKAGNEIASVSAKSNEFDTHVLIISKKGFGKLVPVEEFTKVKRGTKGMMCAKLREGDSILAALFCNKEQELTIVSNKSIMKINVAEISEMKRPTLGVSLKNVTDDEEIIDVSLI